MGGRRWCIAGRGRLVGHDQTGHGQGTCLVTRRRRRAIYLSRPNREQIDRALCAVYLVLCVSCSLSLGVSKGGGLSRRSSRSATNPAFGFWEMGRRPIAKSAKNGARTRQLRLRDKPHSFRVLLR